MKEQKEFKHFVITRMNVDWGISRPRTDRNEPEFLDKRFKLFEEICIPSIAAQTNKDFIWLFLLDSAIPESYRERVYKYDPGVKFIPIYVESKDTLLDEVKQVVKTHTHETHKYLMTTSLDSDDAIAKDFLQLVQNEFNRQDFEFINFPFGYLYRVADQKLYLREWLSSPFHTLIEKYDDSFETVLKYGHDYIKQYQHKQVITRPVWLMFAHGSNVRTNFDVSAAWQPLERLGSNFAVDLKPSKSSPVDQVKEILREIYRVCISQKEWDTGKVKVRKVVNIVSPAVIRLLRRI